MSSQSFLRNSARMFAWLIRMTLGVFFVLAGIGKLRAPYEFLAGVYNYEMVGETSGLVIAVVVPWIELLLGLCLLTNVFNGGCHLMAFVLCAVFCLVQAAAIHRGLRISCSCFGNLFSRTAVNYASVFRSGLLMLMAAFGYRSWVRRLGNAERWMPNAE